MNGWPKRDMFDSTIMRVGQQTLVMQLVSYFCNSFRWKHISHLSKSLKLFFFAILFISTTVEKLSGTWDLPLSQPLKAKTRDGAHTPQPWEWLEWLERLSITHLRFYQPRNLNKPERKNIPLKTFLCMKSWFKCLADRCKLWIRVACVLVGFDKFFDLAGRSGQVLSQKKRFFRSLCELFVQFPGQIDGEKGCFNHRFLLEKIFPCPHHPLVIISIFPYFHDIMIF